MHNFIGFKLFLLLETKVKLLDFLWWRWWQWWYSPKGNFFNPGGSFRQIDCSARCSFLHHLSNPSGLNKKVNTIMICLKIKAKILYFQKHPLFLSIVRSSFNISLLTTMSSRRKWNMQDFNDLPESESFSSSKSKSCLQSYLWPNCAYNCQWKEEKCIHLGGRVVAGNPHEKIPLFQDCVHCANAAQDVKIYQTGASHEQLHIVQMNAAQDVKLYIPPHSQKKIDSFFFLLQIW